jgi:hypothetical protein
MYTLEPKKINRKIIKKKPVDVGANHSIVWKDVQCTIDIKEGVKILSISLNDADFF